MKLYIVEDSPLIQLRLMRMVEEMGDVHVVGVAGDIASASQAILASDAEAMILDMQLSDGNGLNLLKAIKQSKPSVRVVVLTNHSTDENRLQTLRAGADGFLDKSTDFDQIPALLRTWRQMM